MSTEKPPIYSASAGEQQQQPHTQFASLSLHMHDRIRLLQFPSDIISLIRSVIKQSWPPGLQEDRKYAASHEFKLRGNPWFGQSSDAIPSRTVMRRILANLYANGWILHASADISKRHNDKDMLVFRNQGTRTASSLWASVSFNRGDLLRVIGIEGQKDVVPAFRQVFKSMHLLQREDWKDEPQKAWEFKLHGHPWSASGEETMTTRLLMLRLVEALERIGWSLYASIDQSSSGDGGETDSWYVVRAADWEPGMPVFHR